MVRYEHELMIKNYDARNVIKESFVMKERI